ncbi:cobalt ECF transporter T component CbiQ [Ammoniphilus sp. YIM 78166]|uniref:cobalt ECF transporter T component CbiQ n=1 Tax=Ammoniphilus sp. YIM 78166 TaxID=1644106 RepID=UPI0014315175|nr:cobalt ECF transporter T component CbiQ [Ammoniphilus sp. YIM 78166]
MTGWIQSPPLKVIGALLIIVMGVSITSLETLFWLLLLGQGWLTLERIPLKFLGKRLRLILPFCLFTFVFFPLYEGAKEIWIGDVFSISAVGLEKACLYSGRLLFTVQILTFMFYQITLPVFFQSLLQLKVPPIFVEMILFTLRYMEVFGAEARSMLKSLKSRGFKTRHWFSLSSYVTLSRLIGALLIRSFSRAERVYIGMLSRGYRGIVVTRISANIRLKSDMWKVACWVLPVFGLFILDKW